jgi:hypothetical protein
VSHSIVRSQAFNPGLIHLDNTPPTHFRVPMHVVRSNRALFARFFIYSLKLNPLASHSIVRSQVFNTGLIHLNNTPLTRFQVPVHVVRSSRALSARFLIYSLKLTPLASHPIMRSQVFNPGVIRLHNTPLTRFRVPPHVVL